MAIHKFTTVKAGSTGNDVIVLQSLFRACGQLGKDGKLIEIDGICGNNTVYAINGFRASAKAYGENITGANGEFNNSCWAAILGGVV
ncbi:MAG: hypothetical protein IKY45_01565 [Clostridia bacterium]|nr:hypothetical protein [Clostridia bacterium]